MFNLVLLLMLAIGRLELVSTAPNRNERPIPDSVSLRPAVVKITSTAGSGNNKGQQIGIAVGAPHVPENFTCACPGPYGWHDDDIKEIKTKTALSASPFDCFCSGPNKYFLQKFDPPLIISEDCRCPSSMGWSHEELHRLQNFSNVNGNHHQCFCSGRQGYSVNYLQPTSDVEELCQCPISRGWTPDELEQHYIINNLKGGMHDCFCYSTKYGNVLKQKQVTHGVAASSSEKIGEVQGFIPKPQLNPPSTTGIHSPDRECTHCQSGPVPTIPISNSRLVMLSIDGRMREFLLGPMSVTFHK
ncbi:hypothetical protein C0J52_03273 [Blattella germanica]|nr:hypothetical protein C0J52_03273 [Blattella germanica]